MEESRELVQIIHITKLWPILDKHSEVSRRSPWADSVMVLEEVKSKSISCISDGVSRSGTYKQFLHPPAQFSNVTATIQTHTRFSSGRTEDLYPFPIYNWIWSDLSLF